MKRFTQALIFSALLTLQCLAQQTAIFTGKPMYRITTTRGGLPLGSFTVETFPNIAFLHAQNFDNLVSTQFYDSTAFHRCIPGFMIQGGDPNSRSGPINTWGYGQPNQPTVNAEFTAAKHLRGRLSAARKPNPQINSATSQFFICVANYPSLDGQYSVYGRVTNGMNWVDTIVVTPKLAPAPSSYSNMPALKIEMFITRIGSNDSIPAKPTLQAPLNHTVGIDTSSNLMLKWNPQSDGIIYQVQLSRDPTFFSDTVQFNSTGLVYVYNNNRKGNTHYFWRVRCNNGGHYSPWSDTWDFYTISVITGLSTNNTSQEAQVFPNPSSSSFNLKGLDAGTLLEVFDVNGKLVYSALAKQGDNLIDLSDRSKGTYLLKLSGKNKEISSTKLILE